MPNDTEHQIPPALTAEEWRSVGDMFSAKVSPCVVIDTHTFVRGSLTVEVRAHPHEPGYQAAVTQAEVPRLMALANAALPDTDPRKITRAGVDALRLEPCDAAEEAEATRMLAALDALLPPD